MSMIIAGDLTNDIDRTAAPFIELEEMGLVRVGPEGPNYIFEPGGERAGDAWRTLNHAFVTHDLLERTTATALNHPREWGPSDHCRVQIDVGFSGSYSHWTCPDCDKRIGDLVNAFRTQHLDLDDRLHRAWMIVNHQSSHGRSARRSTQTKPDYTNWSCDKCNWGTIERLVNYYKDHHPEAQSIPYGRIVGAHKAYHTRQAIRPPQTEL